jgi:hypothetical protein
MIKFAEYCIIFLPTIIAWHVAALFIWDNSKYQNYRFRKALESIYKLPTPELDIIHKNKRFNVIIQFKEVSAAYNYFEVWINGSLAATFHRLTNTFNSSYSFKEENNRHACEVRSIVYAANKVIKNAAKPKKEKKDGYSEYSYFK